MDVTNFKIKEDEFIFKLLNSSLYKDYIDKKNKVENNSFLIELSIERKEALEKANNETDDNKKRELLIKFSTLTDQIKENSLYIDYFNSHKEVKKILDIINEGIIKKIR